MIFCTYRSLDIIPHTTLIKTNCTPLLQIRQDSIILLLRRPRVLKLDPSHVQVVLVIRIHNIHALEPLHPRKIAVPVNIPNIVLLRNTENRASRVALVDISVRNTVHRVRHMQKNLSVGEIQDGVGVLLEEREGELDALELVLRGACSGYEQLDLLVFLGDDLGHE